jgi:probable F420-dependent oxidoreductase
MGKGRIRFSVQIPGTADVAAWQDKVRRAEDRGFYSVSVPDHLSPELPQLAPLVALTAAAMVTSRLRLAVTVLNNDFRHPVMLAKEVATLDRFSGGRLDVGLGSGWLPADYSSSGVRSFDSPGERVARLEESSTLLSELLAGGEVTFQGTHYEVAGFTSYPMPAQAHVPIMIGGAGRRMLSMAARIADIVSVVVNNPRVDSSLKAFGERIGWIKDATPSDHHAPILGLRIVMGVLVAEGASAHAAAEEMAARRGVSVAEVLDSPFVMVGDLAAVKDRIVQLHEEFGVSYFTVSEDFGWQLGDLVAELSS